MFADAIQEVLANITANHAIGIIAKNAMLNVQEDINFLAMTGQTQTVMFVVKLLEQALNAVKNAIMIFAMFAMKNPIFVNCDQDKKILKFLDYNIMKNFNSKYKKFVRM